MNTPSVSLSSPTSHSTVQHFVFTDSRCTWDFHGLFSFSSRWAPRTLILCPSCYSCVRSNAFKHYWHHTSSKWQKLKLQSSDFPKNYFCSLSEISFSASSGLHNLMSQARRFTHFNHKTRKCYLTSPIFVCV